MDVARNGSPPPELALAALLGLFALYSSLQCLRTRLAPPIEPSSLTPLVPDLNDSPEGHLLLLPGIGPARAAAIRARGAYAELEELLEVPGVGPATVERLRGEATVGGRSTEAPGRRPRDPPSSRGPGDGR